MAFVDGFGCRAGASQRTARRTASVGEGPSQASDVPDRSTVKIGVGVLGKSPALARAKVETYMQTVFDALDKHGAMPRRTQASTLSVQAKHD